MQGPGFVPTAEALRRVPRDLRFHPSAVLHPRHLTAGQVANFNRDGYISKLRVFDEAEIADIRRYFDQLLASTLAAGGDSYSISTAHLRYGRVYLATGSAFSGIRMLARLAQVIRNGLPAEQNNPGPLDKIPALRLEREEGHGRRREVCRSYVVRAESRAPAWRLRRVDDRSHVDNCQANWDVA
jgi:hypothetical protein